MFEIVGTYRGETEVVDSADTMREARYLLGEYRLAFGAGWYLRIRRARKAS